MNSEHFSIKASPRIHITLIGMDNEGYRINGGIGFSINEPSIILDFSPAHSFECIDCRSFPLADDEISRLHDVLEKERVRLQFKSNLSIKIHGEMFTHFGFGSGTAIRLSCMEALYYANGVVPNNDEVLSSSGRGGTSGIGINTYFSGGFILDLGRKSDTSSHHPSHMSENRLSLPLFMQRINMPDWDIGIYIPTDISPKTEIEEVEFFNRTCPIPSKEVYETLYHSIFGVYAAVLEADKQTFSIALREVQKSFWKSAERSEYGERLLNAESNLYDCGASVVGMTSLGPSLFFFAEDIVDTVKKMRMIDSNSKLIISKPENSGRTLSHV